MPRRLGAQKPKSHAAAPNQAGTIAGARFEQIILTVVSLLSENACATTIHEKAEQLAEGRSVSIGAVYIMLGRLEQQGYFTSFYSDPSRGRVDVPNGFSR
jgi:hypothetical protein